LRIRETQKTLLGKRRPKVRGPGDPNPDKKRRFPRPNYATLGNHEAKGARVIEKFTFELHAPKVPVEKIILVKDDFELRNHVVLKLLGYLIYYEPGLKVEISADMHYKPDLLVPGEHTPKVWIDCGKITMKKMESLSAKLRNTRVIFMKENKRELESFKKLVDKKASETGHFEYLAFEPGFVLSLANALQRTNHITLYEVIENVIGIALNDEVFESILYH
jgi:hypothetical protein